jgi:hypothetical protein
VVADCQSIFSAGILSQSDHFARKFVSRGNRGLAIAGLILIAPEPRGTRVTFDVTGANPSAFDFDQNLARTRFRHGSLFQAIILRSVADNGTHAFWQFFSDGTHRFSFYSFIWNGKEQKSENRSQNSELTFEFDLSPLRQKQLACKSSRFDLSLVRFSKAFVPPPSAAKLRFKIAWGEAKRNPRNPPTTQPSSEGAPQTPH